jgi:hypothetical protein
VSEVAQMTRSKLLSLQNLYRRQAALLKRQYKSGRKNYLKEVRTLREKKLSFTTDPKYISFESREEVNEEYLQKEVKTRCKTMAYLKHKRNTGARAVCQLQMMKARQVSRRIITLGLFVHAVYTSSSYVRVVAEIV